MALSALRYKDAISSASEAKLRAGLSEALEELMVMSEELEVAHRELAATHRKLLELQERTNAVIRQQQEWQQQHCCAAREQDDA